MTALRQEAINIIEKIPEKNMQQAVIFLQSLNINSSDPSKRRQAFERLEKFRNEEAHLYFSEDFDQEKELLDALESKYGRIN